MKTKDRILATSLALFNDEGEQNVTTVDIANELDISPGNLYYHFKGKESIITALYGQFEEEINELVCPKAVRKLRLEDQWFYLYVVFEQIYRYRFLYLNLTDITQRLPLIERKLRRLIKQKQGIVQLVTTKLIRHKLIKMTQADQARLSENVAMAIVYWLPYQRLSAVHIDRPEVQIHKGVYHIMGLFAPYLAGDQKAFFNACEELYEWVIEQS